MPTLIGPPMNPPNVPLMSDNVEENIERIIAYLYNLVTYLAEYQPTVEAP